MRFEDEVTKKKARVSGMLARTEISFDKVEQASYFSVRTNTVIK